MADKNVAALSGLVTKHEAAILAGLDAQPNWCWVAPLGPNSK
jgi:hypothetical protein